jgi:hypothetical protein
MKAIVPRSSIRIRATFGAVVAVPVSVDVRTAADERCCGSRTSFPAVLPASVSAWAGDLVKLVGAVDRDLHPTGGDLVGKRLEDFDCARCACGLCAAGRAAAMVDRVPVDAHATRIGGGGAVC